jgi:hypothetical protein
MKNEPLVRQKHIKKKKKTIRCQRVNFVTKTHGNYINI